MENKLQNCLIDDETILWTGSPEFVTLDKTNKPYIVGKAGIVIAAMVIFIAYYIKYALTTGTGFKVSVFVIIAALTALVVMPELLDARKLRKCLYAVTDRRLITIIGENVESVEFCKIKEYSFEEDADGQTSLLCGERAMSAKPRLRRLNTILGLRLTEDKTICDSFAMYGIPEADKVKKLLAKYIG